MMRSVKRFFRKLTKKETVWKVVIVVTSILLIAMTFLPYLAR